MASAGRAWLGERDPSNRAIFQAGLPSPCTQPPPPPRGSSSVLCHQNRIVLARRETGSSRWQVNQKQLAVAKPIIYLIMIYHLTT